MRSVVMLLVAENRLVAGRDQTERGPAANAARAQHRTAPVLAVTLDTTPVKPGAVAQRRRGVRVRPRIPRRGSAPQDAQYRQRTNDQNAPSHPFSSFPTLLDVVNAPQLPHRNRTAATDTPTLPCRSSVHSPTREGGVGKTPPTGRTCSSPRCHRRAPPSSTTR
jgi:hypothetical protein